MPKIGTLSMDKGNGSFTAVAFWLKSKPGSDFLVTPGSDWEVELHRSQDVVVARRKGVVNETDALPAAREAIEQVIDQICFRFNDPLEIKSLDDDYLILRSDGGSGEFTYHTVAPLDVRIGPIDVSVVDAGGAVRLQSTTPMRWMPVLRYYRLSQTRDDVFDAYRYIFLAFEALLEGLYPIKGREGERTWMLRAVREIGKKVNLAGFIQGTSADPASAFIDSQYINVRLRLFHAKKSSGTKPHEGIPEEDVARACSNLTRFCREVLNQQYALGGQSAVMTNVWFQDAVQEGLADGIEFACSEDPSPFDPAQDKFCSEDFSTYYFHEVDIDRSTASGTVSLIATLNLDDALRNLAISRVGAVKGNHPIAISTFDSRLSLRGLDRFQCVLDLKLRNVNAPRHVV